MQATSLPCGAPRGPDMRSRSHPHPARCVPPLLASLQPALPSSSARRRRGRAGGAGGGRARVRTTGPDSVRRCSIAAAESSSSADPLLDAPPPARTAASPFTRARCRWPRATTAEGRGQHAVCDWILHLLSVQEAADRRGPPPIRGKQPRAHRDGVQCIGSRNVDTLLSDDWCRLVALPLGSASPAL